MEDRAKVSELTGSVLDYWVAKAEGVSGLVEKDGRMCHVREWDPEGMAWRNSLKDWVMWIDYAPSQRWDHGGPIIERERIGTAWAEEVVAWAAARPGGANHYGPTPLIAAMRAYVASRFGELVPAASLEKESRK